MNGRSAPPSPAGKKIRAFIEIFLDAHKQNPTLVTKRLVQSGVDTMLFAVSLIHERYEFSELLMEILEFIRSIPPGSRHDGNCRVVDDLSAGTQSRNPEQVSSGGVPRHGTGSEHSRDLRAFEDAEVS